MGMLTSIIVLNWNSSDMTIKCIESLLEFVNSKNTSIYIVDNGSEVEDSQKLYKFYLRMRTIYPVKFIRSDVNLGFGAGNNLAIQQILDEVSDYIWLLNNDTQVDRETLPMMIELLEENSDLGAVGSKLIYIDNGNIQALGGGMLNLNLGIGRHIIDKKDISKLDYLTAASMLIRREVLEKLQGFDEDIFLYWEDVELCLRIKDLGWKLGVALDSVVYHHESSSSNRLGARRQFYFTQGLDVVLRKHTKHNLSYRLALHTFRAINKVLQRKIDEARAIRDYITRII